MDHLQQLIVRYPVLASIKHSILEAYEILADSFSKGKKLLIAGNGGSSADAEHIVGELMKNFVKERSIPDFFNKKLFETDPEIGAYLSAGLQPGLPAISLSGHPSLNTACINDIDAYITFAQQVYGYGDKDDVFLCITTSGNSKNILHAAVTAKAKGLKIIALTGGNGGLIKKYADVSLIVPENDTHKIQELHLPVYHCLCMMLEDRFF